MFCLPLVFLACPRCMLMSGPFPRFLFSSPHFEKWNRFDSQGSFHDQKDLSNDMTTTPTWCHSHLQHTQPPPFMLSFCYTHFHLSPCFMLPCIPYSSLAPRVFIPMQTLCHSPSSFISITLTSYPSYPLPAFSQTPPDRSPHDRHACLSLCRL